MRGAASAAATACAIALLAAGGAAAAPRAEIPALDRATWELPPRTQALIEGHVQAAPPVARRLARRLAPLLKIRANKGAPSRAVLVPDGGSPRFVIELRPAVLRPTHRGRMTFLHELGHVVDWAFVDPALRTRIRDAFAASAIARPCWEHRGGCVSDSEVFAEQFAFWAGARRTLRSGYRVPPLVSRRVFGDLMEAAGWSPDARLRLGTSG